MLRGKIEANVESYVIFESFKNLIFFFNVKLPNPAK